MNIWECANPPCTSKAVGEGAAFGLRAIGWYVLNGPVNGELGPDIRCPAHHPAGYARAEQQAHEYQSAISGWPR